MENRETAAFRDYRIADITEDELRQITDLEKTISSNTHDDIVLIAYKNCNIDAKK